jgi:hypothetical protein
LALAHAREVVQQREGLEGISRGSKHVVQQSRCTFQVSIALQDRGTLSSGRNRLAGRRHSCAGMV